MLGVDQLGQPLPVGERRPAVEDGPGEASDFLLDQPSVGPSFRLRNDRGRRSFLTNVKPSEMGSGSR